MRVLFVDIDTLRPDHMGAYGYHRNTTPNMDRVAAEGMRFDRVAARRPTGGSPARTAALWMNATPKISPTYSAARA